MAQLNEERLAVAAFDALLGGGLEITQHYYDPDPNEWYFKGPMGNVGPFETPESAFGNRLILSYDASLRFFFEISLLH